MTIRRLVAPAAVVLVVCLATQGCALLAVPAVGSAVSGGMGGIARAGAARVGGATARTFSASLPVVYGAVRATLNRLEFAPPEEEFDQEHVTLRTAGIERDVRIDLQPITPAITQVRVQVKRNLLSRDLATATELVAQVAEALEPDGQRLASPIPR
jgi:hypothetical protein